MKVYASTTMKPAYFVEMIECRPLMEDWAKKCGVELEWLGPHGAGAVSRYFHVMSNEELFLLRWL